MRKVLLSSLAVLALLSARLWAGEYVHQQSFDIPVSGIVGADSDAVGNLYVLGLREGAGTYSVFSFVKHSMEPLLSFDTGISSPAAFAVSGSGEVSVLNVDGTNLRLLRFSNVGTFLGEAAFSPSYRSVPPLTVVIEPEGRRIFAGYKALIGGYCLQMIGVDCTPVERGWVETYDYQGSYLGKFYLPGSGDSSGSCYTPTAAAVGPQGNLYVSDALCRHLLRYSPDGTLIADVAGSNFTYQLAPDKMWTDSVSNIYISQPLCELPGCPPGILKLSPSAGLLTRFVVNSRVGSGWDNRILYLGSSNAPVLERYVFDGPPGIPVQSSPLGMVVQHSSAAELAWQRAADPDGDPVTYDVFLGTSPFALGLIGDTDQTRYTTPFLEFGTTYYWQMAARDSYLGMPLVQESAPVVSFNLNLSNAPPGSFDAISGVGRVVTRDDSVRLAWEPASDADGDAVRYELYWRKDDSPDFQIFSSTAASRLMAYLDFGTTYYWKVRAVDVYGADSWMSDGAVQAYLPVFKNSAPQMPPAYVSGDEVLAVHASSTTVLLAWERAHDADGDPVMYAVFIGTTMASSQVETSFLAGPVTVGQSFVWQVKADDPYGGTTAGPLAEAETILANSPPGNFSAMSGRGEAVTRETSRLLAWSRSFDPETDPVSYTFFVSSADDNLQSVYVGTGTSFTFSALPWGTTYYWTVAAEDVFGSSTAISEGVQEFVSVFKNSAPDTPSILSGAGLSYQHTLSPQAWLSWSQVLDPDGDAVSYELAVGTGTADLRAVQDSTALSYDLLSPVFGTTYYWQVSAYDEYGGRSSTPVQETLIELQNAAPAPFTVVSGTGAVSTRVTSWELSWEPALDADDDAVAYELRAGDDPAALPVAQGGTATSYVLPVSFGTTYYWEVRAKDGFGGETLLPRQTLMPSFHNTAPPAPGILAGFGESAQHTYSPSAVLEWGSVIDAEGDAVAYRLELGVSPADLAVVQDGPETSYTLPSPEQGSTHYWRVSAYDEFGAVSSSMVQELRLVLQNVPPTVPAALSGAGISAQHTLTPSARLSWSASLDLDGDPVSHRLFFSTDPDALRQVQDSTSTSYIVPSPAFGTTYYWLVESYDPYDGAAVTSLQSLLVVFDNAPPGKFSVIAGTGTAATRETTALLSWETSIDPDGDPVSYELELSTSPNSLVLIRDSEEVDFVLPITYGTTYYWRVTARDFLGGRRETSVQSLFPVFKNSAPGVPRNLSKTGTIPFHGYTPSQAFFWEAASDPDGDSFTYVLFFGTDSKALSAVNPASLGYTAEHLKVDTPYYYRIAAVDEYGAMSDSALLWVYYEFSNAPPEAFDMLEGSGTSITRETSTRLGWEAAADADGDLVTYQVSVGTSPAALRPVSELTKTWTALSGLDFGTTYYWAVEAFDTLDGRTVMSGGVQSLLHLFQNAAPSSPVIKSSLGVIPYHADAPSYEIAWSGAQDPDGDPVALELYFGADPARLNKSPLASGTTFYRPAALSPSTTYYFKVVARDSYAAVSESDMAWVVLDFYNEPPAAFAVLEGTGTRVTRSTDFSLQWSEAADPEGDLVAYVVEFKDGIIHEQATSERRLVLSDLVFGTTYSYHVCAEDKYGLATCTTSNDFRLEFENSSPTAPRYVSGVGELSQRTHTPGALLSWEPAADADGDPVHYLLALGTDSANLVPNVEQGATSYFLADIAFDTTYYWQVTAHDPYSEAAGPLAALVVRLANEPPNPIRYLSPSSTRTRDTSFMLAWEDTGDPDGEAVRYSLGLGSSAEAMVETTLTSSTSFRLAMEYGSTYYYRVSAEDAFGAKAVGSVRSFVATFLNDPPEQVSVSAAFVKKPQVTTMQDRVDLSWQRVENQQGDPITYTVFLGDSPQQLAAVALIGESGGLSVVQTEHSPRIRLSDDVDMVRLSISDLAYYRTYYLQIAAANPFGATSRTSIQSFTLTPLGGFPAAYAYPVPFDPHEGGTNIVFNAPASGFARAKIEIYSELQDLLFEREFGPVRPGISQFRFDGRDRYGQPLFNGSYICRVRFEEPAHEETFYLMVVR